MSEVVLRMDWQPFWVTFQLAFLTTLILFVLGGAVSYWLYFTQSRLKPLLEALVSMPLILPPTVLGFYFLVAFSPNSWLGRWVESVLGLRLVFSFEGILLGSVIFSLPFMVKPLQSGLESLSPSLPEAAFSLGKSKVNAFFNVLLPNIKPSLIAGGVLSFAHTVGEFGMILMIGGNIPGKTRVASIAIYDEVEALNYAGANFYAAVLVFISFLILLILYSLNRRSVQVIS